MRRLLRPSWLARHLLLLVLWAVFAALGRWQWNVAMSQSGSAQNLLYALQWWSFAVIATYGWCRLVRDELSGRGRPGAEAPPPWVPPPRTTAPAAGMGEPEPDDDLAAYNRYLAALEARYASWLNARSR